MQTIAPGAHIEVRDAVWRVLQVDPTSTDAYAWRCVGVSELVRDKPAVFLSSLERGVKVLDPRKTRLEVDTSTRHRAARLYVESRLREVPPPYDALYVGHQAAMDTMPFQLQPAWQALKSTRPRILIADAVGLGKTLEAGVLLSELALRGRARRILVTTTKSMLTQFQKELWCRFSIPLVRLDTIGLQRIRAQIPSHHNPFHHFDRVIVSIDTLKQDNAFRRQLEQSTWDVVVIDEAHNVAERGGGGSRRHKIAKVLAQRCDALLFLSATPHDGKPRSFASLMNMLDPTAIADPDDYGPDDIRGLYVRRFKHQVAAQLGEAFPERRTLRERTPASTAEEAAFEALHALEFQRVDARAHGGMLFRTQLEKALFSSPQACLETIEARVKRLRRREDAANWADDIEALEDLAQVVSKIGLDDFTRLQALIRLIQTHWRWTGRSRTDRLVIFTERIATLELLAQVLPDALGLDANRFTVLHGGLPDTEQLEIVEDFARETSKTRVLLASDVASEGLNLHYFCHRLVHFDVPWSLMTFQQRNGRIDRYGQTDQPLIAYLFTDSKHPRIQGDQRILEILTDKDEAANRNIGDPRSFAKVWDVDSEELLTATSMERGDSAEVFSQSLQDTIAGLFDDLEQGEPVDDGPVPRGTLPSLYRSDYAYVAEGLQHLAATTTLRHEASDRDKRIELTWTPDLRRRFAKLPAEIRPTDGVVVLTADPAAMQHAMEEARREETAWPARQFLWPLNPVVEWLGSRLQATFGRHTAPVLVVPEGLPPGGSQVVVSGQVTNRRARPLLHRWYGVTFDPEGHVAVKPFEETRATSPLSVSAANLAGRTPVDTKALAKLLPRAVDMAEITLRRERDRFASQLRARLEQEEQRLERLRSRQLAVVRKAASARNLDAEERRIQRLFDDHHRWVADVMSPNPEPFFEVIAVLHRPEQLS